MRSVGVVGVHSLRDLYDQSIDSLAAAFRKGYEDPRVRGHVAGEWDSAVASSEAIRADLQRTQLPLMWTTKEGVLNIRACPGRAHAGHGAFKRFTRFGPANDPKPNTTIEDVVEQTPFVQNVPSYTVPAFYGATMNAVLEIVDVFRRFLNNPLQRYIVLHTREHEPILGLEFLRDLLLDPVEVMRGFYYGANWDSPQTRRNVRQEYGVSMGWGECYPVSVDRMREYGISFANLSEADYQGRRLFLLNRLPHKKRLQLLARIGVVSALSDPSPATSLDDLDTLGVPIGRHQGQTLVNAYIRERQGKGFSDDIGVVLAAFLPSIRKYEYVDAERNGWFSRMVGAFLADHIDTLDKSIPRVILGGLDGAIASILDGEFTNLYASGRFRKEHCLRDVHGEQHLVMDPVLTDFTAAGANKGQVIHSSARYFLMRRDAGAHQTCTLRELFLYVQEFLGTRGKVSPVVQRAPGELPPENFTVGFTRVPWSSRSNRCVKATLSDRISLVQDPAGRDVRVRMFLRPTSSAGPSSPEGR